MFFFMENTDIFERLFWFGAGHAVELSHTIILIKLYFADMFSVYIHAC